MDISVSGSCDCTTPVLAKAAIKNADAPLVITIVGRLARAPPSCGQFSALRRRCRWRTHKHIPQPVLVRRKCPCPEAIFPVQEAGALSSLMRGLFSM